MVNQCFDVFLDLVCENFIEKVSTDIRKGNSSEILFILCVCVCVCFV